MFHFLYLNTQIRVHGNHSPSQTSPYLCLSHMSEECRARLVWVALCLSVMHWFALISGLEEKPVKGRIFCVGLSSVLRSVVFYQKRMCHSHLTPPVPANTPLSVEVLNDSWWGCVWRFIRKTTKSLDSWSLDFWEW